MNNTHTLFAGSKKKATSLSLALLLAAAPLATGMTVASSVLAPSIAQAAEGIGGEKLTTTQTSDNDLSHVFTSNPSTSAWGGQGTASISVEDNSGQTLDCDNIKATFTTDTGVTGELDKSLYDLGNCTTTNVNIDYTLVKSGEDNAPTSEDYSTVTYSFTVTGELTDSAKSDKQESFVTSFGNTYQSDEPDSDPVESKNNEETFNYDWDAVAADPIEFTAKSYVNDKDADDPTGETLDGQDSDANGDAITLFTNQSNFVSVVVENTGETPIKEFNITNGPPEPVFFSPPDLTIEPGEKYVAVFPLSLQNSNGEPTSLDYSVNAERDGEDTVTSSDPINYRSLTPKESIYVFKADINGKNADEPNCDVDEPVKAGDTVTVTYSVAVKDEGSTLRGVVVTGIDGKPVKGLDGVDISPGDNVTITQEATPETAGDFGGTATMTATSLTGEDFNDEADQARAEVDVSSTNDAVLCVADKDDEQTNPGNEDGNEDGNTGGEDNDSPDPKDDDDVDVITKRSVTASPEKISVKDFLNSKKGVVVSATGCTPESSATLKVKPDTSKVKDFTRSGKVEKDGTISFGNVYGVTSTDSSIYKGKYDLTVECDGGKDMKSSFTVGTAKDSKDSKDSKDKDIANNGSSDNMKSDNDKSKNDLANRTMGKRFNGGNDDNFTKDNDNRFNNTAERTGINTGLNAGDNKEAGAIAAGAGLILMLGGAGSFYLLRRKSTK